MRRAAELLRDTIIQNISLNRHTRKELERLGYPYSEDRSLGAPLHMPEYQVHDQTGRLIDAVEIEETEEGFRVGINEDLAPEVKYLIFGTSKMVSRDFITGSYNECKDAMDLLLGGAENYEVENFIKKTKNERGIE